METSTVSSPDKATRPAPITVTDAALARIAELLSLRENTTDAIRVGVRSGGCSGLSYVIEYADEIEPYDEVIVLAYQGQSIKVIIDPKAIIYLIGSVMDYKVEKLQSGFTFQNPNQTGSCGCGESFSV